MFYIIYTTKQEPNEQKAILYSSKQALNQDWLEEFTRYCALHNIDPTSLGAKCEVAPLDEDAITYKPVEVVSFNEWVIVPFHSEKQLNQFLTITLATYTIYDKR